MIIKNENRQNNKIERLSCDLARWYNLYLLEEKNLSYKGFINNTYWQRTSEARAQLNYLGVDCTYCKHCKHVGPNEDELTCHKGVSSSLMAREVCCFEFILAKFKKGMWSLIC
jgi:hypothetical protein